MRSLIFLVLSCSQDVSIMKISEDESGESAIVDSSEISEDTFVDSNQEDTNESQVENEYVGYGGVVEYSLRQVACPQCLGEYQEITVKFLSDFYQPISDSSFGWIAQNGCSSSFYETGVSSVPENYGSNISVTWQGGSSQMNNMGQGHYESQNIPEAYYARSTPHNLIFPGINKTYNNAFVSIYGFDSIEPYTMLWVDPSYAFEPNFNSYSNNTISWAPSGSDVTFQILITFYDQVTLQPMGVTNCFSPDVGYISIPGNYFSYPPYTYLTIQIIKHKVDSFEFDHNYSNIETHMKWEVVGTGMLR